MAFCLEWSGFIFKRAIWLSMLQAVRLDQKHISKTWNCTSGISLWMALQMYSQSSWSLLVISIVISFLWPPADFAFYDKLFGQE